MLTDLEDRALRAYARSGDLDQPSAGLTRVVRRRGDTYVVLENMQGRLAIYRLDKRGRLRRCEGVLKL